MATARKQRRIGPVMLAAVAYVARHPGCPKLPVAEAVGPHGSRNFGYRAVDRAIVAGLIDAAGTGPYSLTVTVTGAAALAAAAG